MINQIEMFFFAIANIRNKQSHKIRALVSMLLDNSVFCLPLKSRDGQIFCEGTKFFMVSFKKTINRRKILIIQRNEKIKDFLKNEQFQIA